jgi:hypothetical protein
MLMPLILAIRLSGTVDRVEGDWVVVEWSGGDFTDLPSTIFSRLPLEGERLSLRLQTRTQGSALALPGTHPRLSTQVGLVSLPEDAQLRPGHRYSLQTRLSRESGFRPPTTPVQEDKNNGKKIN